MAHCGTGAPWNVASKDMQRVCCFFCSGCRSEGADMSRLSATLHSRKACLVSGGWSSECSAKANSARYRHALIGKDGDGLFCWTVLVTILPYLLEWSSRW